jgi:KaiC/GvpD/RAD55 family RecA-like ATPase
MPKTPPPQEAAPAQQSTTSKGKAVAKTPAAKSRSVTVPGPEDFEHAKEDALLQLRIGRSAHLYTVVISAALALDGILVLLLTNGLPSLPRSAVGLTALRDTAFLVIPVGAGVAVSLIALQTKWEAFQLWPWEVHFSTTVAAVPVNVLLAVVYVTRIMGVAPFATLSLLPWFYPAALAGTSLAMVGLVLTWTTWSPRKEISLLAAVLPVATAGFLYLGTVTSAPGTSGLAISLFLSAIFYQTSGSFLHLIASGTRPHERELITSGQSRMFQIADDLRGKEEAVRFRTAALVKREADVENAELSIQRQHDALEEARKQLDAFEADYQARSDALIEKEHTWAGKIAEMDARARQVDDRNKALEFREQEVGRLVPLLSGREQRLVEREGELTKRDVQVTQHEQDVARGAQAAQETEARLQARKKELDDKTAELLRREGEVVSLESAARAGAISPTAAQSDLASREAKLRQFQAVLDEQNVTLGRKAKEITEKARVVQEGLNRVAEEQGKLAAREAGLRQRETDLADNSKAALDRRTEYEGASRDYTLRLDEVRQLQTELAKKSADIERSMKTLSDRETLVTSREQRVKAERQTLDQLERSLTAREALLGEDEAEVGLRRVERLHAGEPAVAGMGETVDAHEYEGAIRSPAGRARGARRAPQGTIVTEVSATEVLRPASGSKNPDRLPTGIPRLDDLLLGGLPTRAHVVVLGDAFVGKEIVLYSFIAEGLKRGEPALLVTGTRSPEEVAASLGLVLPQFKEYEQLGMVSWIDASGAGHPPAPGRMVLSGPSDRAGILKNLVQVSKKLEEDHRGPFRVGFLGLSAVVGGGDAHGGTAFLQNAVGILKLRDALAMYTLEGGAVPEAQVEALLGRMDGAILFRQDRDKTFLSVKGLGEVQTHDWVECRATNRTLVVGSFALERIR